MGLRVCSRSLKRWRFPVPPGVVSVVCCQVEVSASGWSLVQRSPTECVVSEYDLEALIKGPWPTKGRRVFKKILRNKSWPYKGYFWCGGNMTNSWRSKQRHTEWGKCRRQLLGYFWNEGTIFNVWNILRLEYTVRYCKLRLWPRH